MEFTFKSTLGKLDSSIWGLYFDIPQEVSKAFIKQGVKRFVYDLDGKEQIHRAMLSRGEGQYFLYVNKALMKKYNWPLGTELSITMKSDDSEYGMEMPVEFEEVLMAYPSAESHFQSLTPGKQRTLIYMVAKPKREETRIKKAIQIAEYLEHAGGRLDFKDLNTWFKLHNAR